MERPFVPETLLRCRPEVVDVHWTHGFALGELATELPTVIASPDAPLVVLRPTFPPREGDRFPPR